MLNSVSLVGRLVADPELRYTPGGKAVANFRLAVERPFKNQQGEREADFLDIVVWGNQAETTANYCKKGKLVAVTGRIQTRNYEDRDGNKRKAVEVVADAVRFLPDGKRAGEEAPEINDEDLPF